MLTSVQTRVRLDVGTVACLTTMKKHVVGGTQHKGLTLRKEVLREQTGRGAGIGGGHLPGTGEGVIPQAEERIEGHLVSKKKVESRKDETDIILQPER